MALVTAVSVLTLIGATGLIVRRQPAADPAPTGFSGGFSCNGGMDTCMQMASELARRAPLTEADSLAGQTAIARIDQALAAATPSSPSCAPDDDGCLVAPTAPAAEQARKALSDAGFDDVAARTARAGDPAPEGSFLAAVGVGPACVLLYQQNASQSGTVMGRLPDGTCLTV
ncbi:hypothetical protein GCM10010435_81380 [Winogradskya consettensis]|uniref:Uncharacterized protein n=1 Tax=Winogradskya consettensis TaxID=113560 RepID=A0A919VW12_9ACTN|nr:hypothetical protein [Actinoplanes consettensis]GIM78941.1 hypothetical protein Aco04nite_62960 [Actinoplanes consettensis]